jgi:hypothetical protein
MFRYGFFAIGLCLLLTSAFSQAPSQIDGASVVGFWSNAANPNEHFELRADGQFSIAENGQHHEGTWDLQGKTLALHFSASSVGKAQWDGQAFIDNEQKRWVRATLTSTAQNQSTAPPSASAGTTSAAQGQSGDQKASLQERLTSQFKLTKTTNDRKDIVTAGSVLVLQKDGLVMCSVDAKASPTNTYKNGAVSWGFGAKMAWGMALGAAHEEQQASDIPQRRFVAGEKFWVTGFTIQEDGVVSKFYSDPYQDVRYYGQLKFPFPKHTMPPADEELKTIAEAVTVQPDDNAAGNAPQQAQQQPVMAPIPPPPPPPDAPPPPPKTISLGQTRDQVVAIFGQPQKVVNLGTKEIDYYPDMKVTLIRGKVTDVQ